jgi:hypothetical protein
VADDPTDVSASRDAYVAGRDVVVNITTGGGSPAKSGVRLDAAFRYRSKGYGTLTVKNYGPEAVHNLNLEFSDDIQGFDLIDPGLPLRRLPAGKSMSVTCVLTLPRNFRYFDLIITGQTADGNPVRDEIFVDLGV